MPPARLNGKTRGHDDYSGAPGNAGMPGNASGELRLALLGEGILAIEAVQMLRLDEVYPRSRKPTEQGGDLFVLRWRRPWRGSGNGCGR